MATKPKGPVITTINGMKFFSPFHEFKQTRGDNKLLEKWKAHYANLGIATHVKEEPRFSGDHPSGVLVNILLVHYDSDQAVWSREIEGC